MPPKSKKTQHRHVPSTTYLTDDAAFDSEPAHPPAMHMPPPPTRTNDELNLSVLQRHYPSVISILSIANFAHLYNFSVTTQQWEQINSQGPLFVCELAANANAEERYAIILLNRMELKNFFFELTSPAMLEVSGVYLMLTDEHDVVTCMHIVAEEGTSTAAQRNVNFSVVQDCAARAEASRAMVQQRSSAPSGRLDAGQSNLLHLLGQQGHHGGPYTQPAPPPPSQQQQQYQQQQYQQQQGVHPFPQQQQQQQQQWPPQQQYQQPEYGNGQHLDARGGDFLGSLFARAKASQG